MAQYFYIDCKQEMLINIWSALFNDYFEKEKTFRRTIMKKTEKLLEFLKLVEFFRVFRVSRIFF